MYLLIATLLDTHKHNEITFMVSLPESQLPSGVTTAGEVSNRQRSDAFREKHDKWEISCLRLILIAVVAKSVF